MLLQANRVGRYLRYSLLAVFLLCSSRPASALTCSEVRQLVLLYFKMHFSYNSFTDEISRRTLDNFLKLWDPGKMYFYQSDIDEFNNKYANKLDDLIGRDMNCAVIDEIMNKYTQRFNERSQYVNKVIDEKHDFTIDEFLNVDRKNMPYPKTVEEVNERWRKQIKFQLLNLKIGVDTLDKAREKLKKRYELLVRRHNDLTKDKVYGVFLNAFSNALDPHSSYMPAEELEDFRIRTRLSLEGIGASLRSEDGFTIVANLVKGGAAEKGGQLKVNDKIIAVGQENGEAIDVIDMDLQEVVKKIRGARGTVVKLTVLREESGASSKKMIVPIVREKIQLVEQQASSHVVEVDTKESGKVKHLKVGVITLPSFYIDFEGRQRRLKNYRSSSNDTKEQLKVLKEKNVDAVILDLRSNGGGGLDESISTAGLFFGAGPVVQVKASNGDTETYFDPDEGTAYDGPLLVMINRHSASASEIFAGAIQDYNRGLIVGDTHTFGKGTVQNLNDLAQKLGAVKVTVNQFYRASGASTQMKGVDSDLVLPSIVDELEIGEKFYDYALPFEAIKSAKYSKFNLTKPFVPELKKRMDARLATDGEFKKIKDEIEKFRKNKDERSKVSLKEKKDDDPKDKKDKDKKDKDKDEDLINDSPEFSLKDDVYLQETLRVAADYVQLLKKQKLEGQPALPAMVAQAGKTGSKADKAVSDNKNQKSEKK